MSDFNLKCRKFHFGWGTAPVPAWGAYGAPQTTWLDLRVLLLRGGEGKLGKEREVMGGKGRYGKGGKGRGEKEREEKKGKKEGLGGEGCWARRPESARGPALVKDGPGANKHVRLFKKH